MNSNDILERTITFTDTQTGIFAQTELDVLINGFNYDKNAERMYDIPSGEYYYELDFGTDNTIDNLMAYSDSLKSDIIYSNLNPLEQVSWNVERDDYFAAVKHVLVDGDIVIINPLTYNATASMDINTLNEMDFGLQNYVRIKQVYYYNTSAGSEAVYIPWPE